MTDKTINDYSAHSGNFAKQDGTLFNMADHRAALDGQGVIDYIDDTTLHVPSDSLAKWRKVVVLTNAVFETLATANTYKNGVAVPDEAVMRGTIAASNTLTLPTNPTATDTMTIGETVYTFVAEEDFDTAGEIPIGTDIAATQANVIAAIMGTDGVNTAHTLVTIGAFAANVATITAKLKGTAGNSIATTETITPADGVFSAATLGSGAHGTVTAATEIPGQFTSIRLISGSVRAYA